MTLSVVSGTANPALAEAIASASGLSLSDAAVSRFPDGELHVELRDSVRGQDVFLVQPTGPPPDAHIIELLLLADACRRAGAQRLTAVIPYFGYARQDRRAHGREAVGARVIADLLDSVGIERVVAVDLHSASSEAFFRMPLEHLTAVPILIEAIASDVPEDGVIIAPDLGAVKLAERYASSLRLPMAIVHKARISGEAVVTHGIVGEVTGRTPVIVDDMISTGATIEAAFAAARAAKSGDRCVVAATHGLFVGSAFERLRGLPVSALFVTDSLATTQNDVVPQQVVSLAPLLADAIRRLYEGRSLVDLIHHE